jgi:hypothetical protein
MGGGLMQLVAYGAQDVYLTGNPQITFFKVVYRRHTNFSMEAIEQTLNGTAKLGHKVSCTVSRNGDLIHRCYLQVTLSTSSDGASIPAMAGHKLVKSVEVEIGGQRIDRHTGEWLQIWNELTQESGKADGYNDMVNATASATQASGTAVSKTLYVPLQFWFCRNPGLALPLIALQYHEVKINVDFAAMTGVELSDARLYVDYIYLDTEERRRFAQISHEYLIEQLQYTGTETLDASSQPKVKLNFNHPVKCLVWTLKQSADEDDYDFIEHGDAKLQLNGHERFSSRDGRYFSLVQPYQHMPNVPTAHPVHVYSFGLKPAEHQPSGTCNMSRIDNATLTLNTNAGGANNKQTLNMFAVNYNVLRIMSGMGGLAYSN